MEQKLVSGWNETPKWVRYLFSFASTGVASALALCGIITLGFNHFHTGFGGIISNDTARILLIIACLWNCIEVGNAIVGSKLNRPTSLSVIETILFGAVATVFAGVSIAMLAACLWASHTGSAITLSTRWRLWHIDSSMTVPVAILVAASLIMKLLARWQSQYVFEALKASMISPDDIV